MINKKFMLMAIFLVSLIAMSAASANDLNATDEVAIDDESLIIEETSDDVSQDDVLGVKDDGTFTALQNKIKAAEEGSTITLENDYAYDEGFDTKGIVISKSITIDGNGHKIDALGKSRIFYITAGAEFNNVVFSNGFSDEGAAIYKNGLQGMVYNYNLIVSSSTFINNVASSYGGAISSSGLSNEINHCTFINNSARVEGGAINSLSNYFNVVDTIFSDNQVTSGTGGAIDVNSPYTRGNASITNCQFNNNRAGKSGGAVSFSFNKGINMLIFNSTFNSNSATDGGAVYGSPCKIVQSSFNNNAATSGGAIKITGASYVLDSMFASNVATEGGAVYCYNANITDCIFNENSADIGGAIYRSSGTINSVVVNCDFIDNKATTNGASIAALGATSVLQSNFKHAVDCEFIYFKTENSKNKLFLLKNKMESKFNYDIYAMSSYFDFKINLIFLNSTISKGDTFELCRCVDDMGNIIRLADSHVRIRIVDSNGYAVRDNFLIDFKYYTMKNDFMDDGVYTTSGVMGKDTIDYNMFPGKIIVKSVKIIASDVVKYYGGSEKYSLRLTDNAGNSIANANVKVTVNGKTYTVKTDSSGKATVPLDLGVGTYDVVSEYDGTKATSKVEVKTTLITSDAKGVYLNSKVNATFLNTNGKALDNTKVNFKIGTTTYSATTNSNGVATANIPLGAGTYNVIAVNPVNNEQKQFKLTITKAFPSISVFAGQNANGVTLTASLTPNTATGNVTFMVDSDKIYYGADVKNGKASMTIPDLAPGTYSAMVIYNGDSNFSIFISDSVSFKVDDVYPILTANDLTKTYGNSNKFVVNLIDSKGNAIANAVVNVNINNQITPITTDSNGQATMDISLKPESYDATATYGDVQTTAKITVKKATPKITASKKTFKASVKTKKYTITLKTNKNKVVKNKKVTLKVNGKTYSAKTNSKGKATFKITKLTKKGAFNAVIKFAGNSYYNKVTKTVKITVKK